LAVFVGARLRRMAEDFQPLSVLLARQQDVATRAQLLGRGLDDKLISRRIRNGDWQRLLPAVHLLTDKPPGTEQRRIAAALYVDGISQVTGLTALNWYGFRYAPTTDRVHLLIPHERRCRSTGFLVVQRTLELDPDQRLTDLCAVVSPARAVVDACRLSGNLESSRSIMSEAVQSRFTSVDALEAEIRRAKRSRTAIPRRALDEVSDGVRSLPEAELREFAARSTILPKVIWNPVLITPDGERLPSPDGLVPDAWLAIEVDSREYHSSAAGWDRTLARHNKLAEYGIDSVHLLPIEVRREPRRVLRQLERTYLVRMRNPPTVKVIIVQ
jgi:hypothetical protein